MSLLTAPLLCSFERACWRMSHDVRLALACAFVHLQADGLHAGDQQLLSPPRPHAHQRRWVCAPAPRALPAPRACGSFARVDLGRRASAAPAGRAATPLADFQLFACLEEHLPSTLDLLVLESVAGWVTGGDVEQLIWRILNFYAPRQAHRPAIVLLLSSRCIGDHQMPVRGDSAACSTPRATLRPPRRTPRRDRVPRSAARSRLAFPEVPDCWAPVLGDMLHKPASPCTHAAA